MSVEKNQGARKKVEHLRKAVFFTCFVELKGRKERLLKRGAEPCGGVSSEAAGGCGAKPVSKSKR